jgi:hypothetical protein
MAPHDHSLEIGRTDGGKRPKWLLTLALAGLLAIAAAWLMTADRAQILGGLAWLPLLLCPLMHLFMHRGHGGHGGEGHKTPNA